MLSKRPKAIKYANVLPFFMILLATIHSLGQAKKLNKIQRIITNATSKHLVGVAVYIKLEGQKEWLGVAGFADQENKKKLSPETIFSLGSIGKTYTAVAVLHLAQEGRLRLTDPISQYLPAALVSNLPNGQQLTIRHLLSHQSGLFNYETNPNLNELYLSGQLRLDTLSHLNVLKRYVFNRPAEALPGTTFAYSSTNFMLLAMIIDAIVMEGHTAYIRKLITTHGYQNTYYREVPPTHLSEHYGDINQDGKPENLTKQTIETTNWFIGDDGIYAPINEAAHFLEDLMNGKILNNEFLTQMMTWNNNKKPDYGLGLMADKSFPYKFLLGHSGRGIGTTTDLFYFPKQKMTVGIFCNTGIRQTNPTIKHEYLTMRRKIVKKLFLF
ncbi:MAG: serine hydrolase domain-containing protein [Spirosomataceae bacterium]